MLTKVREVPSEELNTDTKISYFVSCIHCVRTGARTFPPADEDTFRRHISVRAGT